MDAGWGSGRWIVKERIGFIGLGVMGRPMAEHLLAKGWALTVQNRSQANAKALAQMGAVVKHSAREVSEASDVIISMVPDTPDVEAVYFGPDGVMKAARPGQLFIDMSTVTPAFAQRLYASAQKIGAEALDAPVSGGDVGARNATLSIMVGGSVAAYERALPVLQAMGQNLVHVGDAGAGQIAKACNQVVVALTIEAVAEALTLAERAGVDPDRVRQALAGGLADSRVLQVHGQRMLEGRFQPGFRLTLHRKDLAIALETGARLQVALPQTGRVKELMDRMIRRGQGDLDHAALVLDLKAPVEDSSDGP